MSFVHGALEYPSGVVALSNRSAQPVSPVPPVEEVSGWVLGEHLGSGGQSEVWAAARADGARAAVKLLRSPAPDALQLQRFLREGALLSTLEMNGLPRCLGYGATPVPHVVLEALNGETLAEKLDREGALHVSEALGFAESLLTITVQMHRNGIIHRDLNPSNLFLGTDGGLKIIDLGLARNTNDEGATTLGDVMGTWSYMAPEQVLGTDVDHRCDLFSIGVTLYELVTGTIPVVAHTPLEQVAAYRDGRRRSVSAEVPDLPARLADTIERLLAWDPEGRPRSAANALLMVLGRGPAQGLSDQRIDLIGRSAALGAIEAALDARMTTVLLGGSGSGVQRMRAHAIELALSQGFDVIGIRGSGRASGMQMLDALSFQLSRFFDRVPTTMAQIHADLLQLASEGPLLVVVERPDLAGVGTAADLAAILNAVPGIAVVVTAERDPVAYRGHRVTLRPLTPAETERLVAALLESSGCPAGLAPALQRVTNGLPGLITAAVHELVECGAIWAEGVDERGRSRWHLDRNASVAPAVELARTFGRDIARMPATARRMLEVMAIAGQATSIEALLDVAGETRSSVVPMLVDSGLVVLEAHPDGERLGFAHPGIGLLLLRQLHRDRKLELHAGLAFALSRRPDAMWLEPRIRWHRAHGAEGHDAADRLLELGEDLRLRGQLGTCVDVLEAAIEARPSPRQAATIHLARGRCYLEMSRWSEAEEALGEARALAIEASADAVAADAAVWQAEVQTIRGDSEHATATIDAVLNSAPLASRADVRVRGMVTLAELHRRAGHPDSAHLLVHQAMGVADEANDDELLLHAKSALAALLIEGGRIADGRDILLAFADQLRFTGRAHLLVPVLYRIAVAWRRLGRVDRALDALDEAADVCRYTQRPHDRALELVGRASVLVNLGDLDGAAAALADARVEADPDVPSPLRMAFRDVQLGLRLARGDTAAALAVAQMAEAEATRAGHATDAAFYLGFVGILTAHGEAIEDALELLSIAGDRRLAARLLMIGAAVGADRSVLSAAEREARASGDVFLLLEAMHLGGSSAHRTEAESLIRQLMPHIPLALAHHFRTRPAVVWARPSFGDGRRRTG